MMQKVLITGVAGFCAKHLAGRLLNESKLIVIGLDLFDSPPENIDLDDYFAVDLGNYKQVKQAIHIIKPDIVYHLAGTFRGSPHEIYKVNFLGGVNLLESIKKITPQARVLLVGSAAEYGSIPADNMPIREDVQCNPINAYGLSKYALTLAGINYFRTDSLKICIARPFNIVGAGIPPTLVIGAILKRAKKAMADGSSVVKIGNVNTKRDFIAVEDVVEGYLQLINAERWGEIFNICSGQPRSIRSVIELLLANSVRPLKLEIESDLVRNADVETVYGSYRKAKISFGFNPNYDFEESLRSTWNFEIGALN